MTLKHERKNNVKVIIIMPIGTTCLNHISCLFNKVKQIGHKTLNFMVLVKKNKTYTNTHIIVKSITLCRCRLSLRLLLETQSFNEVDFSFLIFLYTDTCGHRISLGTRCVSSVVVNVFF